MAFDIAVYDQDVKEELKIVGNKLVLHRLEVPGLAEKRPSVLRGDTVLITDSTYTRFQAYAHHVGLDVVDLSLHKSFQNRPPFKVQFFFSLTPLRLMHRALDDTASRIRSLYSDQRPTQQPGGVARQIGVGAVKLNEEQQCFVQAVVRGRQVYNCHLTEADLQLANQLRGPSTDPRNRRLNKLPKRELFHQTDETLGLPYCSRACFLRGVCIVGVTCGRNCIRRQHVLHWDKDIYCKTCCRVTCCLSAQDDSEEDLTDWHHVARVDRGVWRRHLLRCEPAGHEEEGHSSRLHLAVPCVFGQCQEGVRNRSLTDLPEAAGRGLRLCLLRWFSFWA